MDILPFIILNGLLYGMLLFMLAAGLALIYGLMGVINFAHASFYMLGAYLGYQISAWTNYWVGLFIVPPMLGLAGIAFQRLLIRAVGNEDHLGQLLATFGAATVITEAVQIVWGKLAVPYRIPEGMTASLFTVGGLDFPIYRFFILAVSILIFVVIGLVVARSKIGLILAASQSRPAMVRALGYNLDGVYDGVFAVGVAIAGLAGVMAGNLLGVYPVMAEQVTALLFVIVVVGGLGSLLGALIVAIAIGFLDTAATTYKFSLEPLIVTLFGEPEPGTFVRDLAGFNSVGFAPMLPYFLMLLILLARPRGLFGKRDL